MGLAHGPVSSRVAASPSVSPPSHSSTASLTVNRGTDTPGARVTICKAEARLTPPGLRRQQVGHHTPGSRVTHTTLPRTHRLTEPAAAQRSSQAPPLVRTSPRRLPQGEMRLPASSHPLDHSRRHTATNQHGDKGAYAAPCYPATWILTLSTRKLY